MAAGKETPDQLPQLDTSPPEENLPPLKRRDALGIAVALVGIVVLAVIAGSCEDQNHEQGDGLAQISGGCGLVYLIAGGTILLNLAHAVGLFLMNAVGYSGPFERFFARTSLYGTPVAILAAALITYL